MGGVVQGGLGAGVLLVLFIVVLIGFISSETPIAVVKILVTLVIILIIGVVSSRPFLVSRSSFLWVRWLLWLIFAFPVILMIGGAGEYFAGAALTLIVISLIIGPLIISSILLATIRHRN
jgi:hypothetical protein